MPISAEAVRKRLDSAKNHLKLSRKDRARVFEILKLIGIGTKKNGKPITITNLKDYHIAGTPLINAIVGWLSDRGLIEKEKVGRKKVWLKLNLKGKNVLADLSTEPLHEIKLVFDMGATKPGWIVISHEIKDVDETLMLLALLSTPLMENTVGGSPFDFVREFSFSTLYSDQGITGKVKIEYKNIRRVYPVLLIFHDMLKFYFEKSGWDEKTANKLTISKKSIVLPDTFNYPSPRRNSIMRYQEYWEKKIDELVLDLGIKGKLLTFDAVAKLFFKRKLPIEKYIPNFLLKTNVLRCPTCGLGLNKKPHSHTLINDEVVRRWISQHLQKDPDFFMPDIFWYLLGFESEESKNAKPEWGEMYSLVSHPYNAELVKPEWGWSYPQFFFVIYNLSLAERSKKLKEHISPYIGNLKVIASNPDFYECWKYFRCSHGIVFEILHAEPREAEIFKPIEAALYRYITTKERVDLAGAYQDLIENKRGMDEIVEQIEQGNYKERGLIWPPLYHF